MLQSIQLLRKGLAPADPRLAGALLQYKSYLEEAHRSAEAQEIREQVHKDDQSGRSVLSGRA